MDFYSPGWCYFSEKKKKIQRNRRSQPVNKDFSRDHEELMEADCEL